MNNATNHPSTSERSFYGWKLVAVLFVVYFLNMGFSYFGGAVINTYMLKQIPMDRSTYGLGFTLFNLFIGVPSVVVAAVILRYGVKAAFAIGSVLILAGALWLSFFAFKPWHYLVGFGIVMASGASFSTIVPVTTVVARWFNRYRGRAMAIPLSASGFAGFLGAPLINKILAEFGGNWRQTWLVVAGVAVVSGIIALLFVKERPEDLGQSVDGIPAKAVTSFSAQPTSGTWTPGEAYRTAAYWMIFLGGVACQFPYFFFVAHWILHLKSANVAGATAAWALGLLTLGGIGGRLIGGFLVDKITPRHAFMMGLCCYLVGSILAIELPINPVPMAFAAAIFHGLAFGWTFVCQNAITARYYGPSVFPKLNGMMLLLTAITCSPAGLVGGAVFDRFGSYTGAFVLNILLAMMGIIALSFARTPQFQEASHS